MARYRKTCDETFNLAEKVQFSVELKIDSVMVFGPCYELVLCDKKKIDKVLNTRKTAATWSMVDQIAPILNPSGDILEHKICHFFNPKA